MIKPSSLLIPLLLVTTACSDQAPKSLDALSQDLNAELANLSSPEAGSAVVDIDLSSTLLAALPGAVRGSDLYRSALAREREALAGIDVAQSARRPQASTTLRGGALQETGGVRDRRLEGVYGNLTVSQLLADGGGVAAGIDAASARTLGARADRIRTGNEVALSAANAWLQLWQAQARVALLNSRSGDIDTLLGQIERMAANGMVDNATVDSARRQLVDVNLERARLEQEYRAAQAQFRRYFRALPEGAISDQEIITMSEAVDQLQLWSEAPELKQAAAELLAARADLRRREAAFSPRASIQSGVNSPIDDNDSTDVTVGLVLEYTIASGGQREAEVRASQARVEAAEAALADAYASAEAQAAEARAQLEAMQTSLALTEERIRLRSAEAETARSQIVTGQSSLRELIDAEISNYRAEDEMLRMRAEKLGLQMAIASRVGTLTTRIGLDAEQQQD